MSKSNKENDSLSFLDGLNEEQKEAVINCHFPQLILAGPGSGKTLVLLKKIIYLMKIKKISPENILALTFTRKAANEMRQRITELIGERNSTKLKMGTFHSIFNKILRKNISSFSSIYNSDYKIIEEKEVNKIIKNIIKTHFEQADKKFLEKKESNEKVIHSYDLEVLPERISKKIMRLKNEGTTYKDYNKKTIEIKKDKERRIEDFNKIYKFYVKECKKHNFMDYGDLLLNTLSLFKKIKKFYIPIKRNLNIY